MNSCYKIHILIYLLSVCFNALSVNTEEKYGSNPGVVNYSTGQTWDITQDKQGILYFACNNGLLEFDGARRILHNLPGSRIVRTVRYDSVSERIYCGAFEEFGYWKRNNLNKMEYHSLSENLPPNALHNDDIWAINLGDTIIFHSFAKYFSYRDSTLNFSRFPSACLSMKWINNRLYAATIKGLCIFNGQQFEFMRNGQQFTGDKEISAMLPFDRQRILIATQNSGLYLYDGQNFSRWETSGDNMLLHNHVNRALTVRDSMFVFGTILNGVLAIDRQGRLLWHLHKSNGLQNNTVLGLYEDRERNIWVALDNGVDYIQAQSPLYFYRGNYDNVEAVYDVCKYKETLYLATNKGLFCSIADNKRFRILPETREQVWSLSLHDNQLLCGHNKGTSRIEGNRAISVSNVTGGYCIRKYHTEKEDVLIQSTYTRLVVYKKDGKGLWREHHAIPDFIEPVRYIEIDHHGNIWAGHIEKNVFRIRLNADLTKIDDLRRYASIGNYPANRTGVFKVNNQIVFTTGHSLYTYDAIKDTIISYDKLNEAVGNFASAHKIISTNDKQYWFFCKNELACFEFDGAGNLQMTQRISNKSLKSQRMLDSECIYTDDNGYSFIGLMNGFAVFNPERKTQSTLKTPVLLREIKATSQNNLKFIFAYPSFSSPDAQLFYQLEGLEKTSFPVSASYEKEYSRIPPGNYRFVLKAIDNTGKEQAETSYSFTINPPWYAGKAAITGYVIFGLLLLGFAYRIGALRLRRQHEQVLLEEEKKRQEELAQKEQKIIRLKNEKLESEVLYKAKELASSAMAIIRKNNVLQTLKQELQQEDSKKNIKNIIKMINKNLSSEKEWEMFEANFDMIHDSFFRNLKKRSPQLTPSDLKMCAYLRLNLSTKEIAQLTGNSVRGVEVARYRLRKKLQLSQEQNLNIFMLEFKGE